MKKRLIASCITILLSIAVFGQAKTEVRFDGFYIAKTAVIEIPNNDLNIFTYLRFYEDGTVYTQTVSDYDPKKVSKWFGKHGRFERKGTYKIEGSSITFHVTNDESTDKKLEGAMSNKYIGKILDEDKLELEVTFDSGVVKKSIYGFAPLDTE